MAITIDRAPDGSSVGDPIAAHLAEMLVALGQMAVGAGRVDDAVRIDRIALLEQIKGAASAAQSAEIVQFAQSQVRAQRAAEVHPRAVGRGIAEQIALATKVGAWQGARRLGLARDLWFTLPATYDLLARGEVSEDVAQQVATETSHLDASTRQLVDKELVASGLEAMAPREAARCARRLSYEADPAGSLRRGRTARADRCVTLRPAPDTMTYLTALLPVEQGVACWAALSRHGDAARAAGDPRPRHQVVADTLVERITGRATAADVAVEVQIMMPVDALLDPASQVPAEVPGHGPLPVGLAAEILDDTTGPVTWRRLFTVPAGGCVAVVGGERRARRFPGWLAEMIKLRDQHCREPYCSAPIRHLDHVHRRSDGGETTYANGRGLCERHNYAREGPGWRVELVADRPHTTRTTTPTGHQYLGRPPAPP